MSQYFLIALGSGLGGVARFALSGVIAHRYGETFPWGTLVINVSGSFVIGFFASLTEPDGRLLVGSTARQFVMTGVLGGYTTYSSFSLQTFALVREGEWLRAGANSVATFALCFLAVWLGHICAAWLNNLKGSQTIMHLPTESLLLRIFIGESDRHEGHPLYEAIVLKARETGLAGATVFRSPMGFGASSRLHTAKILRLSDDLPIIVEIVDEETKINAFMPLLDGMMGGGLVTLEKVNVLHYRHENASHRREAAPL